MSTSGMVFPLWLKRVLLGLLSVSVLLVGLSLWVFYTQSGLRFALQFAPASLQVGEANGSLAGAMQLKQVQFQDPGFSVRVEQLDISLDWRPLLRKHVRIRKLAVSGLSVQQPEVPPVRAPASPAAGAHGWSVELQAFTLNSGKYSKGANELAVLLRADAGRVLYSEGSILFEKLRFDETRGSLQADGVLDLRAGQPSDLRVSARLSEPAVHLQARAVGDIKRLNLVIDLLQPQPAQVRGEIVNLLNNLSWRADIAVPELDLKALGIAGPVQKLHADLRARGTLTGVQLQGKVLLDEQPFELKRSALSWGEALLVDEFELRLPNSGNLSASGHWPLTAAAEPGELKLTWESLALPKAWGWPEGLSSARGNAVLSGRLDAYMLTGDLALQRVAALSNGKALSAELAVQLSGTPEMLQIKRAEVRTASGRLELRGQLGLGKPMTWQVELKADGLDPALFIPEWPGQVSLLATSAGRMLEKGPDGTLLISQLGGTLRAAAISGNGDLSFANSWQPKGSLDLLWGANQLQFRANQAGVLQASLDLRELALLAPGAKGTFEGELSARATENGGLSSLDGVLRARLFELGPVRFETLDFDFDLRPDLNAPLKVLVEAQNGAIAGQTIQSLRLQANGTRAAHELTLTVAAGVGALQLAAQGGETRTQSWRGTLASLQLTPSTELSAALAGKSISLANPVQLEASAELVSFSSACLRGEGLSACGAGQWRKQGVSAIQLSELQLPLELANSVLTKQGLALTGTLSGAGQFELRDGKLVTGGLNLAAESPLQVRVEVAKEEFQTLTLNPVTLNLALAAGQPLLLNAQVMVVGAGTLALKDLALGDALAGEITVAFKNLGAFDGFSESWLKPTGSLNGTINLAGTRAEPQLQGNVEAAALTAELPEYGLVLREGKLSLNGSGERLAVLGSVRSGTGVLNVSGWLAPFAKAKAELKLSGTDVLVMDVPRARVVASPELEISHDGELVRLKGQVTLPSARIRLDRFESSVVVSNDVVIVDDPPADLPLPVRADLAVIMGPDVNLKGFGLDGKLTGRVSIRERPKRASTARGEIEVTGTYKAYGQDLKIERGKLLFSSSRLDDPGLDIRAVRVVERFRVGVQVRGTALNPQLEVWSDPALEQAEALSYIVLGRPLGGASGAERALLGNFLARGLGDKVGLELGVETISDVGGAAFTAGKYLSPSLYIGYGQGLFTPQTVFIVRYKLFSRYEFEVISGREVKVGVNYRIEK